MTPRMLPPMSFTEMVQYSENPLSIIKLPHIRPEHEAIRCRVSLGRRVIWLARNVLCPTPSVCLAQ